ncbi:MAG: T9SS type A sorting domain-containing protein [Chitinophagaceae bacterium]|nr:T9SS type A sorting domain-containing protein [Chitinophagaceae bacterium]
MKFHPSFSQMKRPWLFTFFLLICSKMIFAQGDFIIAGDYQNNVYSDPSPDLSPYIFFNNGFYYGATEIDLNNDGRKDFNIHYVNNYNYEYTIYIDSYDSNSIATASFKELAFSPDTSYLLDDTLTAVKGFNLNDTISFRNNFVQSDHLTLRYALYPPNGSFPQLAYGAWFDYSLPEYDSSDHYIGCMVIAGEDTVPGWIHLQRNFTFSVKDYGATEGFGIQVPEISNNTIAISPNPVSGEIVLKGNFESYVLFNSMGMLVKNGTLNAAANKIDVHKLPAGMYYLHLQQNNNVYLGKFIVQ